MRKACMILILMAAAGCATTALLPAAVEDRRDGYPDVATASAEGVHIAIHGDAWHGIPRNLDTSATPILVRVENHSGRALTVRYDAFVLAGVDERAYTAIPPAQVESRLPPLLFPAGLPNPAAFGAPLYGPYSGLDGVGGTFDGPFNNDPVGYYYGISEAAGGAPLPSEDMMQRALEPTVLMDGEETAGFIYFPSLPRGEQRVTFRARLVDAGSGNIFGTVDIPLVVVKRR